MLMKAILALLLLVVAVWALAFHAGARRWSGLTRELRTRLAAADAAATSERVDLESLADLPPPVQRYLRQVLRDGQPRVAGLRVMHRGTFNVAADGARWFPFESDQVVTTRRPGFDWNATVRIAPGLPIRVHDAYVAGSGVLRASLFGLVDMANLSGGGALAEGEMMRWLAESPWYPTVLLPGGEVHWEAIDARSARATVVDGGVRVSLVFLFDEEGLVTGVRSDHRGRMVGGQVIPTPWEGRFRDYATHGGMRIPTQGEVAWRVDGRDLPYWRGRTVDIAYGFEP